MSVQHKTSVHEAAIGSFQEEIDNMIAETAAKEQLISDRTLPFDALEKEYKDASESYDLRKKKLVGKLL